MSAHSSQDVLSSPQHWIRLLQDELTETNREVMALTMELEKRVAERTAELSEAQAELEQKNERLQEANQELQTFTHAVSHDLRGPLRHLQSFAGLLEEEFGQQLGERGAEYLSKLTKIAHEMGVLFDELLKFARMGQHRMERRAVDFNELVQEVIEKFHNETESREIEWVVSSLPSVKGDEVMLRQVWVNLLGNAIKYTRRKGRARIQVGWQQEPDEQQVFFVRDDGVGFDMKSAGKLFDIFERLHPRSEFEGTGVGLALVRRIIERHGGRIWAKSAVGEGATFYFSLPGETRPQDRGSRDDLTAENGKNAAW